MVIAALAASSTLASVLAYASGPNTQKIKISIAREDAAKTCAHDMELHKNVFRRRRDVVVWRLESECKAPQAVLICGPGKTRPLVACAGDPESATVGKAFKLDGATAGKVTGHIFCTVAWSTVQNNDKYDFRLYTGPWSEGEASTCLYIGESLKPFSHALELEVQP